MRYLGTKKSIKEIGRELNVDAVVEGTVTRAGSRVRVTAQLIQVSTDMHLWADSYEREVSRFWISSARSPPTSPAGSMSSSSRSIGSGS